jgi:hypothetical protein
MQKLVAESFSQLHEIVDGFYHVSGIGWTFRGQPDAAWPVIPRAGRPEYGSGKDLGRFNLWRGRACAFADLPTNDWECLAVAQHHGLATRLMDWTMNPLVGAYFAVSAYPSSNGALYCYLPEAYIDPKVAELGTVKRVAAYVPRPMVRRIENQRGLFTYHPDPTVPLRGAARADLSGREDLVQIVIPAAAKSSLLASLDRYGINEVSLFPDLDGLSRYINWDTAGQIARRRARESAAGEKGPVAHS